MFSIIAFDDVLESLWPTVYAFYARIFEETYPYRDFVSQDFETVRGSPFELYAKGLEGFLITSKGEILSCCHYKVDVEAKILTSEVKFLQDAFDALLGDCMSDQILKTRRNRSVEVLQLVIEDERVLTYFNARGEFRKVGRIVLSVLDLHQADLNQFKTWSELNHSFDIRKLSWSDRNEVERFSALYNDANQDVPFQDAKSVIRTRNIDYFLERAREFEAENRIFIAYGLYEAERLVGIILYEGRTRTSKSVDIEFTGIHKRCRGRGVGKQLKAGSTLMLQNECSGLRFIVTGNEESNLPMLAINKQMGFVPRTELTMLRYLRSIREG